MEIAPAILAQSREEFKEKFRLVESFVSRIHLDIADGIFVPIMTIGSDDIRDIETDCSLWAHLMVSKPEHHIVRWLETKADTFSFHVESTDKHLEIINRIKDNDRRVGLVLNPDTPVTQIEEFIDEVDFVQFMTVNPGHYGSPFIETVVNKIKDFHYFYPDKEIAVDGAVNLETLPKLLDVGGSLFAVGSYLFKNSNIREALSNLEKINK